MKTQTVSDVVEEKNIPLDEILDIFEGYGYGNEEMQDFLDSDMTDLSDAFPELKELLNGEKREPKSIDAIKDNFTPPGAKNKEENVKVEDVDTSAIDENYSGKSEEDDLDLYMKELDDYMNKNKKGRDDIEDGLKTTYELIDTNNNGKIEKSEMENFTDSLNDYMSKNPKGRDDIPVTTRR